MAKCNYCGREMLTANGCSYKRVVIKGEHKKTFNRIKVGAPATGTKNPLVLRKRKISAVSIVEPKLATITTTVATSRSAPFVEVSS